MNDKRRASNGNEKTQGSQRDGHTARQRVPSGRRRRALQRTLCGAVRREASRGRRRALHGASGVLRAPWLDVGKRGAAVTRAAVALGVALGAAAALLVAGLAYAAGAALATVM